MFEGLINTVARPVVGLWLWGSDHSWRRSPIAHDSPQVHAPGIDPDRILIAGDGASAGRGVITHQLGLPGYIARNVSLLTGRATDVDIVVAADMTTADCFTAIAPLDLNRFDAVLLSLGGNEALALTPVWKWTRDLRILLDRIESEVTDAGGTIVLSIPSFSINPSFPRFLARVVDRHVRLMNAATSELVETRPAVTFVLFDHGDTYEPDGSHAYQRWATSIAPHIAAHLDPPATRGSRPIEPDEAGRQVSVTALGDLGLKPTPELARLVETATRVLGVPICGVSVVDGAVERVITVIGMDPFDIPREQSFGDLTIRRAAHFMIEDAGLDPRYCEYTAVREHPNVRFYAGYPVEAPDGRRVGAFFVMDTRPRSAGPEDLEALRGLAHRAQDVIWTSGGHLP